MKRLYAIGISSALLLGHPAFGMKFSINIGVVNISDKGVEVKVPQSPIEVVAPPVQVGPVKIDPRQALEEAAGIREKQRTEEAREELRNVEIELRAEEAKLATVLAALEIKNESLGQLQQSHLEFMVRQTHKLTEVEDALLTARALLTSLRTSNESFTDLHSILIDQTQTLTQQLHHYENRVLRSRIIEFENRDLESLIHLYRNTADQLKEQNPDFNTVFSILESSFKTDTASFDREMQAHAYQIEEAIQLFEQTTAPHANEKFISDHVTELDKKIETYFSSINDFLVQVSRLKAQL